MSTAGTIRDSMITQMQTLFPNKTRIPMPRALDQNNDNFLKDGWGIFIGPTAVEDDALGYHFVVQSTDISVVITEKIYTSQHSNSGEASVENSLHGDKESIIDSMADITGVDSNMLALEYIGDDGAEFIFADKNNYLAMTINFALRYQVDKTYCV